MKRIIVGVIVGIFIADLIYKNVYEKKERQPHSHIARSSDAKSSISASPSQNKQQELQKGDQAKVEPIPSHRIKTMDEEEEFEGELPEDLPIDKFKIVYCKYSHGKYYQTLSSYITGNYTSIKVIGDAYPLPHDKEVTSNILMASQVILILFILGSDYIKPLLPFIPEAVYSFISTSRILFAVSCYLFHAYFINKIKATGAFEVYAKNKLIWSTLNQKVLPSYDDIIQLIKI